MKKDKIFYLLSALLCASVTTFAATTPKATEKWIADLDQGTGETEFLALGRPSALKIIGKGSAPRGAVTFEAGKATGTARFNLASLDTGMKMRNEHMKVKYLEVEKYPEATLTLTKLEIPAEKLRGDFAVVEIPFEGKLLLHGIEKPISGISKLSRSGGKLEIEANFGLEISEFGIASPGYAGVTMAKDVKVSVKSSAPFTLQP